MNGNDDTRTRVAVACQGGGSHTAFTAGVLDRLLAEPDPSYEIVALTGTSGGAICAFLAWYGLVSADDEATGRERARELLDQVWREIEADDPMVAAANRAGVWLTRARDSGAPLPQVSPYASGASTWTERYLRRALERAVPPEALARVVAAQRESRAGPRLHVGAVDVTRGTFRTFTERDVTIDAVLASAAIPTLFRAATVDEDGEARQYWDGLFSQNPPVRDLLAGRSTDEKPEEIWLVRINPQRRDRIPTTLESIGDRRNELGGNLSLGQELAFIRRVNEWVADGSLGRGYRQVAVRTIGLDEDRLVPPRALTAASKLDCRPSFVGELERAGRDAAGRFLDVERNRRLVRGAVEAVWAGSPVASVALADDFALHGAGAEGRGPAVYEAYVERFRAAVADPSFRIESDVAERDRVALVWTASGQHVGRLFGVEPSDESVSIRGVQIARIAVDDGNTVIAEAWIDVDEAGFAGTVAAGGAGDAGDPDSADGAGDDVPVPAAPATPVVTDLRSAEEAHALALDHAELFWGDGRLDVARRVVDADHVFRRARRDVEGRDAYEALVESYRAAFPDLRVTVRDAIAEGDRIVVRAVMTGTHAGPFEGIEPTDRRVEAHWTFVHEVGDGRIVATGMIDDHGWLVEQASARPVGTARPAEP